MWTAFRPRALLSCRQQALRAKCLVVLSDEDVVFCVQVWAVVLSVWMFIVGKVSDVKLGFTRTIFLAST